MSKRFFQYTLVTTLVMAVALAGFSTATIFARSQQAAPARTIWDGIYSEDQAKRGGAYYDVVCSECHNADLRGQNGILIGDRFMNRFREDTLQKMFAAVKETMPRNRPGSLNDNVYVDIISYILSRNAIPAGTADLRPDAAKDIQFVGKDGAAPMPAGALAQSYGCLTVGPNNTWVLTQATDFGRTRNPDPSSSEELKAAATAPAGTHTYQLADATFFRPAAKKDQKVEAKGFVVTGAKEGLSLTSLTSVSPTCQ